MSDHWFSPVLTRTQANRMFSIAATSDGHVYPLKTGEKSSRKTIFELLQDAGISWRVYVANGSPTFVENSDLVMFSFADSHPENFALANAFPDDVASGNFPQVVFISEGQGTDEHPAEGSPGGSVQTGSSYVRDNFLEPLLRSPIWKDSVFVLAWDEGGGFYDHMAPQPAVPPDDVAISDLAATDYCFATPASSTNTCGFNHTGYRVPLMVISPFSKKNYVSHAVADHTAVLKLIETRFSLAHLTERDNAQIDMSTEFFDFVNAPWMTPPPTTPAQPSPGQCDFTLP
jgi:phospholipase C